MTERLTPHHALWENYKPTARGIEEHFQDFCLTLEDLKGKKILDIGSGLNEFANELADKNIDMISLDPFYALSREERENLYDHHYEDGIHVLRKLLNKLQPGNRSSELVAGRSEMMPFAPGSFDLVISHYASPYYAEDAGKLRQFFSELSRVLASGGEARLYPSYLGSNNETYQNGKEKSDAYNDALDDLKKQGYEITKPGPYLSIRKPKADTHPA